MSASSLLPANAAFPRGPRKERFAEDHFVEMLQSGHINAILRRLKELHPQDNL